MFPAKPSDQPDILHIAMPHPRRILLITLTTLLLGLLAGCQKASINTNEAVRAAVLRHLEARGDLGLTDLDIQVISTKFDGDTSEAEVRFLPKGQPPDAGMTMHYILIRDGDVWKVQPKANSGHGMPPPTSPAAPEAPAAEMPPGHPPVNPAQR